MIYQTSARKRSLLFILLVYPEAESGLHVPAGSEEPESTVKCFKKLAEETIRSNIHITLRRL